MAILVEKQKAKRVTVVVPFVKMSAQMKITGRCAHIVEENYPEAVAEGFE